MPKKKNQTTGKPSRNTSFPYDFTTPNYLDIPTKPIEVEKPINGFDYLNALVRIPEVRRDLELLNKDPNNREKKLELYTKYFGVYGFSLELSQNLQNLQEFLQDLQSQKRINLNKYFPNSDAIHVFSNWEKGSLDAISKYRDGRHVILAVDVTKKKRSIINEFKKLLDNVERDYSMPGTTRDKETVENIWEIYDYKTKNRLNFTQIARKVSGLKGNPTHNERLKAYLERVKRAFRKAKGIIDTVKQEVEKTIALNMERQKAEKATKEFYEMLLNRKVPKARSIVELLTQHIRGTNNVRT